MLPGASASVYITGLENKLGFELESINENNYTRNGVQISTYRNILTKDRYINLYNRNNLSQEPIVII